MKDVAKRAGRTFVQAFIGSLALLLVPFLFNIMQSITQSGGQGEVDIDLSVIGNLLLAACIAGVIALISFIQNLFEDKTGVDVMPK